MEIKIKDKKYYRGITNIKIDFQEESHSMGGFLRKKDNFSIKINQLPNQIFKKVKVKIIKPNINYLSIKGVDATAKEKLEVRIIKAEAEFNVTPLFFNIPILIKKQKYERSASKLKINFIGKNIFYLRVKEIQQLETGEIKIRIIRPIDKILNILDTKYISILNNIKINVNFGKLEIKKVFYTFYSKVFYNFNSKRFSAARGLVIFIFILLSLTIHKDFSKTKTLVLQNFKNQSVTFKNLGNFLVASFNDSITPQEVLTSSLANQQAIQINTETNITQNQNLVPEKLNFSDFFQTSEIIANKPVSYTMLVKRDSITSSQYLLKIPKEAINISIKNITEAKAQELSQQKQTLKPKNLTLDQRKQLADFIPQSALISNSQKIVQKNNESFINISSYSLNVDNNADSSENQANSTLSQALFDINEATLQSSLIENSGEIESSSSEQVSDNSPILVNSLGSSLVDNTSDSSFLGEPVLDSNIALIQDILSDAPITNPESDTPIVKIEAEFIPEIIPETTPETTTETTLDQQLIISEDEAANNFESSDQPITQDILSDAPITNPESDTPIVKIEAEFIPETTPETTTETTPETTTETTTETTLDQQLIISEDQVSMNSSETSGQAPVNEALDSEIPPTIENTVDISLPEPILDPTPAPEIVLIPEPISDPTPAPEIVLIPEPILDPIEEINTQVIQEESKIDKVTDINEQITENNNDQPVPPETTEPAELIAPAPPAPPAPLILPALNTQNIVIENYIQIDYQIPAPKIKEKDTNKGKMVTVSAENEDPENPLTDVLAYTKIPEIFKVGQEDKIRIKWKNNDNQEMQFKAYDLDSNGMLDYVEWTVPHLSEQTFDIIYISRALYLDKDKNTITDIYDLVKSQDNNFASLTDGQYIRVTFEKVLNNLKNITLYARSQDQSQAVSIEVYAQESGQLVATFNPIDHDGFYKVYLTDLQTPTDVFDLKIIGSIYIDYIIYTDFDYGPNQILTPTGYKNVSELNIGDEVVGYDHGAKVINVIENIQFTQPDAYDHYEQDADGNNTKNFIKVPFVYYLANEKWELYTNQSVFTNHGVVHAFELQVGDTIYDATGQPITINTIRSGEDRIQWMSLTVSGNHSYVADDLLLHNASRYWVGGGSSVNWDATSNTNWGSASNTQDNASVPTSADDVFFDGVGTGASNSTLSAAITVRSVNFTGYANTLTHNTGSIILSIGDGTAGASNVALSFSATMTYSPGGSSGITFTSTSVTQQTITTNGKTLPNIIFNGSGGSWQLQDDLNIGSSVFGGYVFTNTAGTLDTNSKKIIMFGGSGITFSGRGQTYYQLDISNAGNSGDLTISGANTFTNLNINGGNFANPHVLFSDNQTVTGTLTLTGFSTVARLLIQSNTLGTARTLTAATVTVTNADFRDITGAGAGSWDLSAITGGSGDAGGNSGITFTTAQTNYWVGGTGNWSAVAEWANASGGAASSGRVPLPQDDATFDANSFSAGSLTTTLDMPRAGKNINWTGVTNTPAWAKTTATTVYGSVTMVSGMTNSGTTAFTMEGRSTFTWTSGTQQFTNPLTIAMFGGTLTLQDDFATSLTTTTTTLSNGTFDANGKNFTTGIFSSSNSNTRTVTMGAGTWTITGNATTVWTTQTSTNLTFNAGSNIVLNYSGATGTRIIQLGTLGVNSPSFNVSAGTDTFAPGNSQVGSIDLTGFSGTWANGSNSISIYGSLNISATTTLTFSGAPTWTFAATSGTKTITTNGKTIEAAVTFNGVGGTWQLADALTVGATRAVTLTNGTLDANNNNFTMGLFSSSNSNVRTILMGTGTWELTATTTSTVWTTATATNLTLTPSTSTIKISGSTTNVRTFSGGGKTFGNMWITNATSTGEVDFVGSNTFTDFKQQDATPQTIKFTAASTTTVTTFSAFGTASNLLTIGSITAAGHTLTKAGAGDISSDYLSISRSTATPTNTWYAGTNSTDGGNNSGWIFTAPVADGVSGTVYSDEGTTPLTSKTIAVSINGAAAAATTTSDATTGAYSFTGLTVSSGDIITLYIDGATEDAVTVTKIGAADLTGVNLYQNYLITRSDNGVALTNSNLDTANNNADADITGIYTNSGTTITVVNGKTLYVPTSHSYTPGATLNVGSSGATSTMKVAGGTFTHGTETLTVNGNYTQAGGTFAGGSGTIDINGTFTLSGGTFTSTSGTLTVGNGSTLGNWTHTAGGTFTHNSGTVDLSSYSTTIDVTTSETFNNLTHTCTANCVTSDPAMTIAAGDTLVVLGTFTHTDGHFGTGTVEARGNVSVASTADGGTALLTFSGTADQTYTDSGGDEPNGDITINKASGTVTLASNADWGATSQDVTITSGTLDLASYTIATAVLTVGASGTLQLQGGETVTATTKTYNAGSTVIYNGTGSYLTSLAAGNTYSNLTFNGSGGVWEPGGAVTVNSNLTITAGTFDIDGQNLTVTGTFSNSDKLRLQGGETTVSLTMDTDSGTVEYDGTTSYTGLKAGNSYNNLTFNGTGGTWTLNAVLDVNDTLTLSAGTLDVNNTSNYGITVASWTDTAAGDQFTERAGTVTFDTTGTVNANEAFYNVTINGSGITTTLGAALDVNGTMTLTAGTLDVTTSNYGISVAGNWTDTGAGTFTEGTGTVTFDGTGTVNANETFNSVTINSGGTVTLGAALDLADTLTITAGALDVSGSNYGITAKSWTDTGAGTFTEGTGTVTFDIAAGTINANEAFNNITINHAGTTTLGANTTVGSVLTITAGTLDASSYAITLSGTTGTPFSNSGTFTASTGTISYTGNNGAGNTTVANVTYNNLTLNNSSETYILGAALDVNDTITITAGTLDVSGSNFGITAKSWTDTGAGTFTEGTGTVTFDVAGGTINSNETFENVTINHAGTTTLGAALDLDDTLTITTGALDVSGSNYGINLAGDWSNSGTFTQGTGTVTFDGADQTLSGSTTFYNLTKTVAVARTLTFPASATQTIATGGTLTLAGASGQLLTLASSSTPTKWGLTLNGTAAVSYVDVKDSDASGGTAITQTNSTDSGNNLNWTFDVTAPTITNVSSDKANGSYTTGEVIDIDITFSETVTSTGNVTVTLETGTTDQTCAFTVTSATTGTCNYTVVAGDTSADLTVLTISGTIADAVSNAMTNFAPATNLADNKAIVIDTTAPTVNAGSDQSKSASFTQDATVSDAGGIASYLWTKVSGSGTITFGTATAEDTTISASVVDTYVIRLTVTDNAGNSASDDFTLVWSVASSGGGGGGSVSGGTPAKYHGAFSISINSNNAYTNNQIVTLSLNGGTAAYKMAISNSPDFINTLQENYQKTKTWILDSGDGQKTVYVKFYTQGGLESEAISDSITLDTVSPEIKITSIKNNYSSNEEIIISGATESNTEVTLLIDNEVGLFNADQNGNWSITLGKMSVGTHHLEIDTKDFAGNTSQNVIAEFSVILSLQKPTDTGLLPDFILAPPLAPIFRELAEGVKSIIPKFFQPIAKSAPEPTAVVTVPKITPLAFGGTFHYVSTKTLARFVLAPLPTDVKLLAQKFPEVQKTFNEVGVQKITDLQKLLNTNLKLPSLTETVITQTDITAGKFAIPKGIPVEKLSISEKAKIPSAVVFAKTAGGLVDFNVALSLNNKGKTEQTIQTIAGHSLQLVVRADKPVRKVTGYIIFKSKKYNQPSSNIPLNNLTASLLFSNPDFTNNVAPSIAVQVEGNSGGSPSIEARVVPEKVNAQEVKNPSDIEQRLVLTQFEYQDSGNGIYTANVVMPVVDGEYEIITVMDYEDVHIESKEIKLITVVDPEGYVYEKNGEQETRISGAIVSLYWLNPDTKQYELWPAKDFQQEDPQTTDVRGIYSFLVPNGYYYLKVDAPGYLSYDGKPFEVKEGSGIHIDIELKTKYWFLNFVDWKTILLIVVILMLLYNFYRDRMRERKLK